MPRSKVTLTVLFDNVAGRDVVQPAHGFSCLLEGLGRPLMFDTGSDAHILLANMTALGKDPKAVATIVLSHPHWDHTGGLFGFLHETGARPRLILPKAVSKEFIGHARMLGAEPVVIDDPCEIAPGLHSTGQLPSPDGERDRREHALVLETADGLAVVTGCAHPGVVALARRAGQVRASQPTAVFGGFHLRDNKPGDVDAVIAELRGLGVRRLGTSHCTGDNARRFRKAFGDSFVPFSCGDVVEIEMRA